MKSLRTFGDLSKELIDLCPPGKTLGGGLYIKYWKGRVVDHFLRTYKH